VPRSRRQGQHFVSAAPQELWMDGVTQSLQLVCAIVLWCPVLMSFVGLALCRFAVVWWTTSIEHLWMPSGMRDTDTSLGTTAAVVPSIYPEPRNQSFLSVLSLHLPMIFSCLCCAGYSFWLWEDPEKVTMRKSQVLLKSSSSLTLSPNPRFIRIIYSSLWAIDCAEA